MVPGPAGAPDIGRRSSTSTRRPASPSRCSTPTGHLETFGKRGAGWFWWRAGEAARRQDRRLVRLERATRHIGTLYWRQALRVNLGIKQIETKSTTIQPDLQLSVAFFHAWGSRAKFACVRGCLFDGYWTTLDERHEVIEIAGAP